MFIYDPATYDFNTAIPPVMGRVRSAMVAEVDARLAPLGLKTADYIVLAILANGGSVTASTVCSFLAHDPGAMTRKIDALEARGLVRRVRSDQDRRAIKLDLTPEGKKLFPKALAVAVGVANDFLEGFTKAEVKQLEGMLQRILVNAGAEAAAEGN